MRRLTKIGAASAVLVLALAGCAQDDEEPTNGSAADMCDGGGDGPQVGLAYEWWRNKYGVDASRIPGARQGTPLLVAEYHF